MAKKNFKIQKRSDRTDTTALLKNKLVITTRNPTKQSKKLCTQLRKVFDPDCMTNLKEANPRFKDCLEVAEAFRISHFVLINGKYIQIGQRPRGPTYTFEILEYDGILKECPQEIYSRPVLVTFDGKSELKSLFERFGRAEPGFKRSLHFSFNGDEVYMRHYRMLLRDTDDNFVVGLKEIGPKLKLRFVERADGFFIAKKNCSENRINEV